MPFVLFSKHPVRNEIRTANMLTFSLWADYGFFLIVSAIIPVTYYEDKKIKPVNHSFTRLTCFGGADSLSGQ